ncbi:DUF3108 domain-containing protein [Pseudoalteromonas sp. T1lg65]|uniref:DUF3108 domain-containing protein n=1 Tax=Pseudoalteromonas sp. T1lg65 TaxID=2077101 RepID=UPI003F7A1D80
MLLGISALLSSTTFANTINEYHCEYEVSRKGKIHGTATRDLTKVAEKTYAVRYQSEIEWMIFSDIRTEESLFELKQDKITPLHYSMKREGTGPDKSHKIKFDHASKEIRSSEEKYPLKVEWLENQQDLLSYQVQLRRDLKAGKTQFSYPIIDKNGNQRSYDFQVVGEEMITLPVGNINTIKVKRLYDNSDRQAIAWFAPEHDHMLVQMYKGKDGVEQFKIALTKFELNPN